MLDDNIAVNCVAPSHRGADAGAASLIPDSFPTEPVEYLAETVLAMCHLPAADRTGLVAFWCALSMVAEPPGVLAGWKSRTAGPCAAGARQPEHPPSGL